MAESMIKSFKSHQDCCHLVESLNHQSSKLRFVKEKPLKAFVYCLVKSIVVT